MITKLLFILIPVSISALVPLPPEPGPEMCTKFGCFAAAYKADPYVRVTGIFPLGPYPTEEENAAWQIQLGIALLNVHYSDKDKSGACDCEGAPGPQVCVEESTCDCWSLVWYLGDLPVTTANPVTAVAGGCDAVEVEDHLTLIWQSAAPGGWFGTKKPGCRFRSSVAPAVSSDGETRDGVSRSAVGRRNRIPAARATTETKTNGERMSYSCSRGNIEHATCYIVVAGPAIRLGENPVPAWEMSTARVHRNPHSCELTMNAFGVRTSSSTIHHSGRRLGVETSARINWVPGPTGRSLR